MTFLDVLCLAAATTALCRAWFQGGGWVAAARQRALAWGHFPGGWRHQLGHLLGCPLCLSLQVCLWLALIFIAPSLFLPEPWRDAFKLPLYTLAAAALVPFWRLKPPVVANKELLNVSIE